METTKLGLVQEQVRLVKKDEELVSAILKARGYNESLRDRVREMLRYNTWTTKQLSGLTGLAESTLANKCRPAYKEGKLTTELDFTYTHPDIDGDGPKFIIRNERSEVLLPVVK
jgi:hypothetical protein